MARPVLPGLQAIVERKIEEAIARGELDHLPGAGKPLDLDDVDPLVPEEQRIANRVLKNAGLLPSELARFSEIQQLLRSVDDEGAPQEQRASAGRRLQALLVQMEASGHHVSAGTAWQQYHEALLRRFAR